MSSSDSDKPPTCPAGTTNTAKATGEEEAGGGVSGSHSSLLHGTDIAQILQSQGPIVKAVLLRHMRKDGRDAKPHPPSPTSSTTTTTTNSNSPTQQQPHKKQRVVLTDMIDEIEIDTTPSKAQVKAVLGGPFTFLGQYPDQGTVLMIRKELPDYNFNEEEEQDLNQYSIKQLRQLCNEFDVNVQGMIEKDELIEALQSKQELPINPHHLQPPFDGVVVRGDILILRVAETPEELDQDDDDDDDDGDEAKQVRVLTNEEFFLDYTKEEYIAFASRTDIVAPEIEENEQDAEGEDEEEEEDAADEDYDPEEEAFEEYEEGSEEEKRAMLNVIMSEVLKKFRENNGRGPDTRELLELRSQVAQKLGVEVASFQAEEPSNRKRSAGDEDESHASKKVKFSGEESNSDDNRDQSNGDDKEEEEETS